jgi:hypothetical protein
VEPIRLVASKLRREDPPAVIGKPEHWLTSQQAADYLQIHKETLLPVGFSSQVDSKRLKLKRSVRTT